MSAKLFSLAKLHHHKSSFCTAQWCVLIRLSLNKNLIFLHFDFWTNQREDTYTISHVNTNFTTVAFQKVPGPHLTGTKKFMLKVKIQDHVAPNLVDTKFG